jgi:geranylgeranyl diphosphate synthase type I
MAQTLIKEIIDQYLPGIEQTMRAIVDDNLLDEPEYSVMVRYAMGWVDKDNQPYEQQTGKRLRPTLLLLCNETAGGIWQDALPAAACVELLHNFSLVHDDIQDDSDVRHNRPTVWKIWGAPNAINCGDILFTLSYMALQKLSENLEANEVIHIWQQFNKTNIELTRGQHLDMHFETIETVSIDDYISMIAGKSAALISACARFGAYIATCDEKIATHYADFGRNIGIAFQIHDDILGIWGDPDVTGKSVATDIISQKKSLPVLYGLSQSERLTDIYHRRDFGADDVEEAVQLLEDVSAREYAREQERIYYNRALESLQAARPEGKAADRLQNFVEYLFRRTY